MIDESLIGVTIQTTMTTHKDEDGYKTLMRIVVFYPMDEKGFWKDAKHSRQVVRHYYKRSLQLERMLDALREMKEQLITELKEIVIID